MPIETADWDDRQEATDLQALHGLDVVRKDVQTGGGELAHRSQVPPEVRCQALDQRLRSQILQPGHGACKMACAAIGQVIAIDRCQHDVAHPPLCYCLQAWVPVGSSKCSMHAECRSRGRRHAQSISGGSAVQWLQQTSRHMMILQHTCWLLAACRNYACCRGDCDAPVLCSRALTHQGEAASWKC